AEDGIRDDLVTGVQTCALPIYGDAIAAGFAERGGEDLDDPETERDCGDLGEGFVPEFPIGHQSLLGLERFQRGAEIQVSPKSLRSEERRVGKECRSRWRQRWFK